MVKELFYHFLETKEKEEENTRRGLQHAHARCEIVERNNRSPQLLHLFPWEIKKVISTLELEYQVGLELNPKQVKAHLLMHLDDETNNRVIKGEKIPIQMLDLDTGTEYQVFFSKWPNHDIFLILGSWFREFAANRNLIAGMTIGLYWDMKSKELRVSVLDKSI